MNTGEVALMEQKYTVDARANSVRFRLSGPRRFWMAFWEMLSSQFWWIMRPQCRISPEWGKMQVQKYFQRKKSDNEFQVVIRVKDRKPTEGGEETEDVSRMSRVTL